MQWYPGAIDRFREVLKAIRNSPDATRVYFHLAESLLRTDKKAEALPYYERLLSEFEASEYLEQTPQARRRAQSSIARRVRRGAFASRNRDLDPCEHTEPMRNSGLAFGIFVLFSATAAAQTPLAALVPPTQSGDGLGSADASCRRSSRARICPRSSRPSRRCASLRPHVGDPHLALVSRTISSC